MKDASPPAADAPSLDRLLGDLRALEALASGKGDESEARRFNRRPELKLLLGGPQPITPTLLSAWPRRYHLLIHLLCYLHSPTPWDGVLP